MFGCNNDCHFPEKYTVKDHISNTKLEKDDHYYNLNCQFLFLRNIKLKNNFQCFENQKLKMENGQFVVFISCF